ncbi:hypothetical protein DFH27DRAFT_617209 [Peziza echinospora]|nr:hypothetical protein DFH27DRAFT_617209 [Peziza echinospora]
MLGPDKVDELTKRIGCWFRFATSMQEYYFEILKLLQAAFPESAHSTYSSSIRACFNDAQTDCFIRKQQDLLLFSEQCWQYDYHLKLHPVQVQQRVNQFTFPSGTSAKYRQSTQTPGYFLSNSSAATAPPATAPTNATPLPMQPCNTSSAAPTLRPRDPTKHRQEARLTTVADRLNPATKKTERSFMQLDGTVKFLERSCTTLILHAIVNQSIPDDSVFTLQMEPVIWGDLITLTNINSTQNINNTVLNGPDSVNMEFLENMIDTKLAFTFSVKSKPRRSGDMWDTEAEDKLSPLPVVPDGPPTTHELICADNFDLSEWFSKGIRLGHIDPKFSAEIVTEGPLTSASTLRLLGPCPSDKISAAKEDTVMSVPRGMVCVDEGGVAAVEDGESAGGDLVEGVYRSRFWSTAGKDN